jgi:hypothetical protein
MGLQPAFLHRRLRRGFIYNLGNAMQHFVPFFTVETGSDLIVSFPSDEGARRKQGVASHSEVCVFVARGGVRSVGWNWNRRID